MHGNNGRTVLTIMFEGDKKYLSDCTKGNFLVMPTQTPKTYDTERGELPGYFSDAKREKKFSDIPPKSHHEETVESSSENSIICKTSWKKGNRRSHERTI